VSTPLPPDPQTLDPEKIGRTDPDRFGSELENLAQFLDYHRATFEQKCAGLDADQLKRRAVSPSTLSLLGLARHLSEVERHWFAATVDGQDVDDVYCTPDNRDGDFDDLDSASAEDVWQHYSAQVAESRRILSTFATADDSTRGGSQRRPPSTLRWVLLHLIEEYARHNGHADFLREAIDGRTGE
jgi:uncharacterized damage-inducible protein DinB